MLLDYKNQSSVSTTDLDDFWDVQREQVRQQEFEPYQQRGGHMDFDDFMKQRDHRRSDEDIIFASDFARSWCREFSSPRTGRSVRKAIARMYGALGFEIDLDAALLGQEEAAWLMKEAYILTARDPAEQMQFRSKAFWR